MTQAFDQIDLDISEDGVDVIFMGWSGDYTSIATIPLASLLERGLVSEEQWRKATPPLSEFSPMEPQGSRR